MRDELGEQLYKFVYVVGKIQKFGKMKFDGHKRILERDPSTGMINPVRFTDGGCEDAVYFKRKATLIVEASINGEIIGDGHMWIPEDLSMKGFNIGDKVKVCGNVEIYQRKNKTNDYCVNTKRIEHVCGKAWAFLSLKKKK